VFVFSEVTFLQARTFREKSPVSARTGFLFALHEMAKPAWIIGLNGPVRSCQTRFEKTKRNHREVATKNRYMAQVNRASAVHSTREFTVAVGSCSRKTASLAHRHRFITRHYVAAHNRKSGISIFQNNQSRLAVFKIVRKMFINQKQEWNKKMLNEIDWIQRSTERTVLQKYLKI